MASNASNQYGTAVAYVFAQKRCEKTSSELGRKSIEPGSQNEPRTGKGQSGCSRDDVMYVAFQSCFPGTGGRSSRMRKVLLQRSAKRSCVLFSVATLVVTMLSAALGLSGAL